MGTFSQAQQFAISDELENMRKNDMSREYFFTQDEEPFFVKNLETIQGDERDVIFISVGYGRDENGKLSMNFGPLNKDGGERRLNVLVTRARDKVIIFSSILGSDLDLTKTKSRGVYHFKNYLNFAQSEGDKATLISVADYSGEIDESNIFELSVYEQLRAKGIIVSPQVGLAGYKIDFVISHPDEPSRPILAVECDGAYYHSSKTARDRDRLRQDRLEALGWRFHRIWSTDWFSNPSREMTKLLDAIEEAKNKPSIIHNDIKKEITVRKNDIPKKPTNQLGIEIISYEKYPVHYIGKPKNFYYDVKGSKVKKLIESIVRIESPIHVNELSLRVIQHYHMKKVGAKILKYITSRVKAMHINKELNYESNFVYRSKHPYKKIRKRDEINTVSNIELVSAEEIRNAILLVLIKELSVPKEELIPRVARVFGFQHTGKKIQLHLKKEISHLLREKKISDSPYGIKISK